jgi:isopentenyl-diphosphate delta-isomerase
MDICAPPPTSPRSAGATAKKLPNRSDTLILVDERNRARGTAGKALVHRRALLHRAFSIFLVDGRGRLLLQQRQRGKYHSAGLWANSCCGHPRPGEPTARAAQRRLNEELGLASALTFGFFARYRAALDGGMHENEFVYVYFGPLEAEPKPDPAEISAIDLLTVEEVRRRIGRHPNSFAAWLKHYFRHHAREIATFADAARGMVRRCHCDRQTAAAVSGR